MDEPEDFSFKDVDDQFVLECNLLSHFILCSQKRILNNPSTQSVGEVFLVLREVIDNWMGSVAKNTLASPESKIKLNDIIHVAKTHLEIKLKREKEKDSVADPKNL